jgi:hypothetical protein
MTIKTLSGTYANGYTLAANYTGLSIASSGVVDSAPGAAGTPGNLATPNGGAGGGAGVALTLPKGGSLANHGHIVGGQGGAGGAGYSSSFLGEYGAGGAGGAGGIGASSLGPGVITNFNIIDGGLGGHGGAGGAGFYGGVGGAGGFGGVGLSDAGGGAVANYGSIAGGAGGLGGAGGVYRPGGSGGTGGIGGHGGLGLNASGGAEITNRGVIVGGAGGHGGDGGGGYNHGATGGAGGAGGVGLYASAPSVITNRGVIYGGPGGSGGSGGPGYYFGGDGGAGGDGGIGFASSKIITLTNYGAIEGGLGGAGGAAGAGGSGPGRNGGAGLEGTGIVLIGGGTVINGSTADAKALVEGGVWGLQMSGTGTVANFGTISGASSVDLGSSTDRLIVEAGSKLIGQAFGGGGTLELAGGTGLITDLGDNGVLTGATAGSFREFGAYVVDSGSSWSVIGQSGLRSGQTLDDNGGRLKILGPFYNAGLIEASGGVLIVAGATVKNAASGTIAAAGGRVYLQGADIIGGTLTASGKGLMVAEAVGGVLDGGPGHALTVTGALLVADKASLTIEGSIVNKGTIEVGGGADLTKLLIGTNGVALSGGGALVLGASTANHIDATAAQVFTNLDNRISGGGTLGDANLTLVNDAAGVIDGDGAVGLIIDTGANTIVNAGLIEATAGATTIKSAIRNNGHLDALHGTLTVDGAVSGTGVGGVLAGTLAFGSSFTENVAFLTSTPSGVLELAQSQSYGGTIYNFSKTGGTSFDLRDIGFITGKTTATYSGTIASGTLIVTDGTHTAHIHMNGDYLGSTFNVTADHHGGTSVVDPAATTAPVAQRFIAASASMAAPPASAQPSHEGWRASASMLTRPGTSSAGCFA